MDNRMLFVFAFAVALFIGLYQAGAWYGRAQVEAGAVQADQMLEVVEIMDGVAEEVEWQQQMRLEEAYEAEDDAAIAMAESNMEMIAAGRELQQKHMDVTRQGLQRMKANGSPTPNQKPAPQLEVRRFGEEPDAKPSLAFVPIVAAGGAAVVVVGFGVLGAALMFRNEDDDEEEEPTDV